jgi:hypothetical protein
MLVLMQPTPKGFGGLIDRLRGKSVVPNSGPYQHQDAHQHDQQACGCVWLGVHVPCGFVPAVVKQRQSVGMCVLLVTIPAAARYCAL